MNFWGVFGIIWKFVCACATHHHNLKPLHTIHDTALLWIDLDLSLGLFANCSIIKISEMYPAQTSYYVLYRIIAVPSSAPLFVNFDGITIHYLHWKWREKSITETFPENLFPWCQRFIKIWSWIRIQHTFLNVELLIQIFSNVSMFWNILIPRYRKVQIWLSDEILEIN